MRDDAARAVVRLGGAGERFAVVFADPPYDSPRAAPALGALAEGGVLLPGALVVVQHATKTPPPASPGVLTRLEDAPLRGDHLDFLPRP